MVESQFQVIKLVPHHPRSAMFSTFRSSSSAAVGPDPRSLVMLEDQWMIVWKCTKLILKPHHGRVENTGNMPSIT